MGSPACSCGRLPVHAWGSQPRPLGTSGRSVALGLESGGRTSDHSCDLHGHGLWIRRQGAASGLSECVSMSRWFHPGSQCQSFLKTRKPSNRCCELGCLSPSEQGFPRNAFLDLGVEGGSYERCSVSTRMPTLSVEMTAEVHMSRTLNAGPSEIWLSRDATHGKGGPSRPGAEPRSCASRLSHRKRAWAPHQFATAPPRTEMTGSATTLKFGNGVPQRLDACELRTYPAFYKYTNSSGC